MNQLLLGASLPFVVGLIAYALRGFRATLRMLVIWPACMALSALWAVIPDLPRLLGMKDQYLRLNSWDIILRPIDLLKALKTGSRNTDTG